MEGGRKANATSAERKVCRLVQGLFQSNGLFEQPCDTEDLSKVTGTGRMTWNKNYTSAITLYAPGHETNCVHHSETLVREEARD